MGKTLHFAPGFGQSPPFLAGRVEEQTHLSNALGLLMEGGPREHFVMHGPRGMGKTALLRWFRDECAEAGAEPVLTTPSRQLKSPSDIPRLLLPPAWHDKWWLPKAIKVTGGLAAGLVEVMSVTATFMEGGEKKQGGLADHAVAACKGRPRVILLDEAHTVKDMDLYQTFLNEVQSISGDAPLMVVLAGTPGLELTLAETESSFVGRATWSPLGALSHGDAIAAIEGPMKDNGVTVPLAQLGYMAGEAQCYPYFLQVWGKALTDVIIKDGTGRVRVTEKQVKLAQREFDQRKERFYHLRYSELLGKKRTYPRGELLKAAYAVGKRFLAGASPAEPEINSIIKDSLDASFKDDEARVAKAAELQDKLHSLDYFWSPPGKPLLPGFPSLMSYVESRYEREMGLGGPDHPGEPAKDGLGR